MFDSIEGRFWTGTALDGVTINRSVVPTDVQAWAVLASRFPVEMSSRALAYAQQHMVVDGGFDFDADRDGIWYEGTAQMAAAWASVGDTERQAALLEVIRAAQDTSGGVPATDRESVTTGFTLANGQPWLYYRRLHVGATAWYVLAATGTNPFWM